MGIVQGLTEFLPISSSGHLIIVPFLFGWTDPFITSLAFSVMLHIGTLAGAARLLPGRLGPARPGRASRPSAIARSVAIRTGGWRGCWSPRPSRPRIAGFLLSDLIETTFRDVGLVALTLVVGAVILWLADRWGGRTKGVEDVTFPIAIGIGAAQALALIPGISRSGISISAARFAGLDREAAARFSFLMATPDHGRRGRLRGPQARDRRGRRDVERRAADRRACSRRSWPG